MSFERACAALLTAAAACSLIAWEIESSAAADLRVAEEIQQREVPDAGGAPPSIEEYEEVLTTLDDSIAIRGRIDGLLGRIEGTVRALEHQQQDAIAVVEQALTDLGVIAQDLSSSASATRLSAAELHELAARLARAGDLARAIAEELEELDNSLGPSAGGGP